MMGKNAISIYLIIFLSTWSHALLDKSDESFENQLNQIVEEYPTWISENNMDFTNSDPNPLVLESDSISKIFLHCELTDRTMTESSTRTSQTVKTSSDFSGHTFGVRRVLKEPIWFVGKYYCTGNFNKSEEDGFMFSGNGTYMLLSKASEETVVFRNVGVNQDHKLDMNLFVSYSYNFKVEFTRKVLGGGMWSDDRVHQIISDAEEEFGYMYNQYLNYGQTFPLIVSYLANKTSDLDLTNLMDANNLPEPYTQVEATTIVPYTTEVVEISTASDPSTSTDGDGITQTQTSDFPDSPSSDGTETSTSTAKTETSTSTPKIETTTSSAKPKTTTSSAKDKATTSGTNKPTYMGFGNVFGVGLLIIIFLQ